MSERDDLFTERGLSPRRVAFWLHHWQELRTLAETPGSSRDLREYVRREWVRLQERHPSIVCLCGPTDSEPQRPSAYAGGGTYGPSSTFATPCSAPTCGPPASPRTGCSGCRARRIADRAARQRSPGARHDGAHARLAFR
jgi:hypothetical protein